MRDRRPILVGSETQYLESLTFVTGIQRVVLELHSALTDVLSPRGAVVVPLHTRDRPRATDFRAVAPLAGDPVLEARPIAPEDADIALFVDLHVDVDFARVFRERRRRRLPVVSFVHDLLPLTDPEMFLGDARTAFRLYLQQLLAVSDHIVVSSEKVRTDLAALGWRVPGDIHVIPLGSSFRPRAVEPAPDDRISILYVSTVEPRKGHDLLLDAYDLLREQGRDVDLTIVGRHGWDVDRLVRRLREHPDLGGRLRWFEAADDLTVATLARDCSIGVFPAANEGFGLFVEEGLAYGLKMVVSDIPVFRERAQANVSFADRTAQGFADAIERAHRTPWIPLAGMGIRSMRDFGRDVADLVGSVLP